MPVPDVRKVDPDDDFGDPDLPEEEEEESKPIKDILEKPTLPDKPKIKPGIPEKPKKLDNKNEEAAEKIREDEEKAAAVAAHIQALQENAKLKAKFIKEKERNMDELFAHSMKLQQQLKNLNSELNDKSKMLQRLQKTDQLLSGDDDALEKVKSAVNSQVEKLMGLSQQWEKHRRPLIDEVRKKKSPGDLVWD